MSINAQAIPEVARQVALSRWRGGVADVRRGPEPASVYVIRTTPDTPPCARRDHQASESE